MGQAGAAAQGRPTPGIPRVFVAAKHREHSPKTCGPGDCPGLASGFPLVNQLRILPMGLAAKVVMHLVKSQMPASEVGITPDASDAPRLNTTLRSP